MALRTMGTTAQTSLSAILFSQSPLAQLGVTAGQGAADMAALKILMKDDLNPLSQSPHQFFDFNGQLVIPRRGILQVFPGDFVAVDTQTGWPILISAAAAAANPSWVHNP